MNKLIAALIALTTFCIDINAQITTTQVVEGPNFDRLSQHLQLRSDQLTPVKQSMDNFYNTLQMVSNMEDKEKAGQVYLTAVESHKATMRKLLTEKQNKLYEPLLDTTLKHYAEKYSED